MSLRPDPKHSAPTSRVFDAARCWVAAMVARGQELGVVRSDLPNTLLIDSVLGLVESLDPWVVTHWTELTEAGRAAMPAKHIGMFKDLVGVR